MSKLKPCPFCGGEAEQGYKPNHGYVAYCPNCGIGTGYNDTEERAIEVWNRRTAMTSNETVDIIDDTIETIIKALEKQIPKKPKKDIEGLKICPNCQSHYIFGDDDIMYDYCPDCGQRLG